MGNHGSIGSNSPWVGLNILPSEGFMAKFSAAGLSTAPVNTVLEEGPYSARIVKLESIVSAQKKTPGLHIEVVMLAGPVQANGSMPAGRHAFGDIWIAPSGEGRDIGLRKLAKLCRACDIEQTDELDLEQFLNKELVVRIKHRSYNGETREEIADFKKQSN